MPRNIGAIAFGIRHVPHILWAASRSAIGRIRVVLSIGHQRDLGAARRDVEIDAPDSYYAAPRDSKAAQNPINRVVIIFDRALASDPPPAFGAVACEENGAVKSAVTNHRALAVLAAHNESRLRGAVIIEIAVFHEDEVSGAKISGSGPGTVAVIVGAPAPGLAVVYSDAALGSVPIKLAVIDDGIAYPALEEDVQLVKPIEVAMRDSA